MNWKRFFTGFIIITLTFLFLYIGNFIFSSSITLIAVLASWELHKTIISNPTRLDHIIIYIFGALYSTILIISVSLYGLAYIPLIISINTLTVAIFTIFIFEKDQNVPLTAIKQISGLVYISIPLSFLVAIRNSDYGFYWSLATICIISSSDIGAYYIGSSIGNKKLSPYISKKKTIEGSIGGLISSIIVAIFLKFYFLTFLSIPYCVLFACLVGAAGQIGDLFASEFKRMVGIKDYGNFLPGHGGILDRIDAILMGLPVAYLLYLFYPK